MSRKIFNREVGLAACSAIGLSAADVVSMELTLSTDGRRILRVELTGDIVDRAIVAMGKAADPPMALPR